MIGECGCAGACGAPARRAEGTAVGGLVGCVPDRKAACEEGVA